MTAAVEFEHQVVSILKSAHELGCFGVLRWGKKRFPLKRIYPIRTAPPEYGTVKV